MKDLFPKLPIYSFSWRSIYAEPVPGSGERISLATIIKGEDSQFQAARTITGLKIRVLFGQKTGIYINDALGVCLASAGKFYKANPLDRAWEPPIEGFYLGGIKHSLANSFEGAMSTAASQSSSFNFALQTNQPSKATATGNIA